MIRVFTEDQKENLRNKQTRYHIHTPDGVFKVMEAANFYGISKHTVYQRCRSDGFQLWCRKKV